MSRSSMHQDIVSLIFGFLLGSGQMVQEKILNLACNLPYFS